MLLTILCFQLLAIFVSCAINDSAFARTATSSATTTKAKQRRGETRHQNNQLEGEFGARRLRPLVECTEQDDPIYCDSSALPDTCSESSFVGCGVLCDNFTSIEDGGEGDKDAVCVSSTFQDGSADCKDGACFNSSFTNMDIVDCHSVHDDSSQSCQSSTFSNSQQVICEDQSCNDSNFDNVLSVECESDSCDRSIFRKSEVDCGGHDSSCGSSNFYYSAVHNCKCRGCKTNWSGEHCFTGGYYCSADWSPVKSCVGAIFHPCSCCDGEACPPDVPGCTEDFCFTIYLGKTCQEHGNPFCNDVALAIPTSDPSSSPTETPTISPTSHPPTNPSFDPTPFPTFTIAPTSIPTLNDTVTIHPTTDPTQDPSQPPTEFPSVVDGMLITTGSPSLTPRVITAAETDIDTTVTIVLKPEDIFGTSSDVELDRESAKIVEEPLNGDVTIIFESNNDSSDDNLSFDYTPHPGFEGKDDFTFMACDIDGVCLTLRMEVSVEAPKKEGGKEGLYALLSLLLAPLLWIFQEPLKRLYDKCLPTNKVPSDIKTDGGAAGGAATTAAAGTAASTTTPGIPTSIGIIDETSFASETSIPDDEKGNSE